LFDELDEGDHRPAADQIREARGAQMCPKVSILCPPPEPLRLRTQKSPGFRGFCRALARTRTVDPFLTMEVLYQLSYEGAGRSVAAHA
jgi:hypothetical protein